MVETVILFKQVYSENMHPSSAENIHSLIHSFTNVLQLRYNKDVLFVISLVFSALISMPQAHSTNFARFSSSPAKPSAKHRLLIVLPPMLTAPSCPPPPQKKKMYSWAQDTWGICQKKTLKTYLPFLVFWPCKQKHRFFSLGKILQLVWPL